MNIKLRFENASKVSQKATAGRTSLFSLMLFLCVTLSYAQAPANDLCADAEIINCGDTVNGSTAMSTGVGAPTATCGTTSGAPGNWYTFAGTGDIVDLALCGSTYDTKIQVYSGDCTALVCIGGNDDSCGLQSEFSFITTPGTDYFVYVFGFGSATGNYTLSIECTPPPPAPVNDECDGALVVDVNNDDTCTLVTPGTVAGGTPSATPNTCTGNADDDVWFEFEATATAHIISILNIQGNDTNVDHSVFEGDCTGAGLTNLYCSTANLSIASNLTIGETYYIRAYTFGSNPLSNTTFDVCVSLPPAPPANDECDNAIMVDVNLDNSCDLTTPGTVEGATPSANPNTCGGTDDDDVWFSFIATSENLSISLNNVSGSTTDLYHVLYEGTDCNNLTQLYCSDPNQSLANNLTVGNTYFIRVYTFTATALQNTTFDVCVNTILPPDACLDAMPFCSQDGLIFPNESGGAVADPTIDYECLFTQPNPSWFFLQIDQTGDLDFEIVQNTAFDAMGNPTGTPLDVDFIAWGPFTDVEDGCNNLNPSTSIACSYSAAPVENFSIPNAMPGEIYILLITNFNGNPGFISLQQTNFGEPGTGSTDCAIVFPCTVEIDQEDNQILCDTQQLELTTTASAEVETYQWFLDGNPLAGETNPTLTVDQTGVYRVEVDGMDCDNIVFDEITVTFEPCAFDCAEDVFVEDFATGTGRTTYANTTLNFNPAGQLEANEYAVTSFSDDLNTGWHNGMEDNTPGDTNGQAIFFNPSEDPAEIEILRIPVTVEANMQHEFEFFMTTVYDIDTNICPAGGTPSNLIFQVEDTDGNIIAQAGTGDVPNEAEPNWNRYSVAFNPGAVTNIELVINNNIFGACGNDFAIDDIRVVSEGTPPVIEMPANLELCDETGNEEATFDLTVTTAEILNGQDPADFVITYHLSQDDADNDENEITTPTAYVNTSNPETIFVRVERAGQENCYSTTMFDLVIIDPLVITTNLPTSVSFCDNVDAVPVDATPTNAGIDLTTVTYEWTDPSGAVVSTDAVFAPQEAGTYLVTITVPPCSTLTVPVEVIVFTTPDLDLGPDVTLCDGEDFEIVPMISGDTTGTMYAWSTGETSPTITVATTGTYSLEITSADGCITSDSIEVIISDPVDVSIDQSDFDTCPDFENVLSASSSDATATFQWFMDGTLIAGETNNTLTISLPANSDTVEYSVVVTNGDGCMGSAIVNVSLFSNNANCIISQGISPNGDGLNDELDLTFLAERTGIEKLQIFNRLGRSVYELVNYRNEWTGQTNDGEELPTGTYYYILTLSGEDSVFGQTETGWVYINREAN